MSEYIRVPVIGADGKIGGSIGEGIFDGINAPFAYSKMWYEAQEPESGWALEKKPGVPYRPGQQDAGLVMIGPAMGAVGPSLGTDGDEAGGFLSRIWPLAVVGAVGLAALMLVGAVSMPMLGARKNPSKSKRKKRSRRSKSKRWR